MKGKMSYDRLNSLEIMRLVELIQTIHLDEIPKKITNEAIRKQIKNLSEIFWVYDSTVNRENFKICPFSPSERNIIKDNLCKQCFANRHHINNYRENENMGCILIICNEKKILI